MMKKNKLYSFAICIFTYMLLANEPLSSQPTIEIVDTVVDAVTGEKSYALNIDGKLYIALTDRKTKEKETKLDHLKIDLKAAHERIKADSSLISTLDTTVAVYNRNIALKDSLISEVKDLYIGYKDLYFDYKRVYSEPWLNFSGGIGALRESSGDNDVLPVILLGISIKRVSLWGFINNEQSGFIFGLNYPIRFNFSLL